MAADRPAAGELLRGWRTARGMSQMKLAHAAGISPRHMSFIETGRSRPGRDVLLRLAERLDLSLRERNVLLESAGHARIYGEPALSDPELERVRDVLEFLLARHEPFGAVVVDSAWRVQMSNRAHRTLMAFFVGNDSAPVSAADDSGTPPADGSGTPVPSPFAGDGAANLLVQLFHPDGLRRYVRNWPVVAHVLAARLQREADEMPTRGELRTLLERIRSFGLPPAPPEPDRPSAPVLPLHLAKDGVELRLLSVITTFGTPQDVTVQELRIETFLPADEATDRAVRGIVERPSVEGE